MSYEAAGVFAMSVLIALCLWVVTSAWAVSDSRKTKRSIKWTIISLVPLIGPLFYHVSKEKKPPLQCIAGIMRKNWPAIAIIIIILLSMYVRLIDYRWPYLRNIDSYTFYRSMDEIVMNDGIIPLRDELIMAPNGAPGLGGMNPYIYLGAYAYMLVSKFVNITLAEFLVYFPPFLASLAIIPLYFIGKMLYDRKAGILAAFIYIFDINNLARSLGGDPDSDAIIFLISMITVMALLFTYKYSTGESRISKKLILYSVLTGITVGVWFNSWAGYWYIFWLFTGLVILRLVFNVLEGKNLKKGILKSKFVLTSFLIYMCIGFAIGVISFDFGVVPGAIFGPIQFQSIKGEDYQFPNVYVSVAELQQGGGFQDVIARTSVVGGVGILISPFFMLMYTLIYLMYSYYKRREHIDTLLLLAIWFIGPLLATTIAVRFSVLFSAPLAIGSAIFLSKIIRVASGEDKGVGE